MNSPRTSLYRDKQNGKLMGVCSGIAEYTGINAFWIRLASWPDLRDRLARISPTSSPASC